MQKTSDIVLNIFVGNVIEWLHVGESKKVLIFYNN